MLAVALVMSVLVVAALFIVMTVVVVGRDRSSVV